MSRRLQMITSSIGKKQLQAITGLSFLGFLVIHLIGNLNIFAGLSSPGGELSKVPINKWGETLELMGPMIPIMEAGLALILLVHIVIGMSLWWSNLKGRGQQGYFVNHSEGGRSVGSQTMWITGPIILVFILVHLFDFTIRHKTGNHSPLNELISERLHNPVWLAGYVVAFIALGIHLSHGFWSALQTLGVPSRREGGLRSSSTWVGALLALAFIAIAGFVYTQGGLN